jgi:hypothetical protein
LSIPFAEVYHEAVYVSIGVGVGHQLGLHALQAIVEEGLPNVPLGGRVLVPNVQLADAMGLDGGRPDGAASRCVYFVVVYYSTVETGV